MIFVIKINYSGNVKTKYVTTFLFQYIFLMLFIILNVIQKIMFQSVVLKSIFSILITATHQNI